MPNSPTIHQSSAVATTGSDGAKRVYRYRERTPRIKESDLHKRERLVIRYMVHGVDHHSLAERVIRNDKPVLLGEPLTIEEAARLCLIRRGHARWLMTQPAFQRELARETAAFREGAKARAWRRVDALAHHQGDGKAADRKVQLQAAAQIIGEPKSGTTVNVQTNVGFTQKAGVIWRIPETAPPLPGEPAQIEGKPE